MASPSHKMSEENLEKKMQNVTNTQDSIQSLSLWLIHHKSHHRRVVDVWIKTFKKASSKHKLVLFNLCNDVCQNGKRKKAGVYIESFRTVLAEAIGCSRDKTIQPNITRILKIWGERNIFQKAFLNELVEMLTKESPAPTPVTNTAVSPATPAGSTPATPTPTYKPTIAAKDEEKILAEFKPQMLIDKINCYKRLEGDVELKFKQISSLKLDASSVEAVTQLKDRAHGKQFSQQFEDSCSKLENYVTCAEQQILEEKVMIDLLEQSEVFYDEQYREARIVANAYKNFGTRINNLRKKLEELMKSLPSPVPSPSYDAPSPGNTPPLEEIDNTEAVDMDLDEEDSVAPSTIHAAQQDSSISNRTEPPETEMYDPEEQLSSKQKYIAGPNALESRIATMIPSLPTGSVQHNNAVPAGNHQGVDPRSQLPLPVDNPPVYNPPKPAIIKVLQEEGTPTKDEGSSTPVLDEKEDSPPRTHQNPIDFLTQILSKTPKTSTSNSSFLQNLSLLTNTVKSQFQQNREAMKQPQPALQPPAPQTPNSWAEWKAQMKPEEVPQAVGPPLGVPQPNPPQHLPPPMFSQINPMSSAPQPASVPAPTILSPPIISPSVSVVRPPPLQAPRPNFIPQQVPSPEAAWNPQPPIPPPQPFPSQPNFSAPTGGGFPSAQGDRVSPTWNPPSAPNSDRPSTVWNPPPGPPDHSLPLWNPPAPGPPPGNNWTPPVSKPEQNWGSQGEGSWNRPWDQTDDPSPADEESSANVSPLPPPPKGILRNRKSSLKEVPITPSKSLEDNSFPNPPGEPPSAADGKLRPLAKEKTGNNAPDDHREFLEKLKKKTTGASGSNLVSPPVVKENPDKAQVRSNLANVSMGNSENNTSATGTDGEKEGEHNVSKIETVSVERRYQSKHDDIRMPEKPQVHRDYEYEDDYERHDNDGFGDDYRPPYRGGGGGQSGPRYRHPGPYRGERDSGWRDPPYTDRPRPPPPRHYRDQYSDYRRPYYY